ncbi:MAG: FecR domain-containing protein [Armatimonadetes bacterium]|nr:FecR domain-containing protein [Armatimonadota bacterium]
MSGREEKMLERLDRLTAALPDPELPEGFHQRLMARFEKVQSGEEVLEPIGSGEESFSRNGNGKVTELRRSRRGWRGLLLAVAASLVAVLGLMLVFRQPSQGEALAFLAASTQPVEIVERDGTRLESVTETVPLERGAVLRTGKLSASVVTLPGRGNELRVGEETELKVARLDRSQGEFQLEKGRVWITEKDAQVTIRTAHAVLIPVGTEYEAIVDQDSTEVVVWDGLVMVQAPDRSATVPVGAGQELEVGFRHSLEGAEPRPVSAERQESDWHQWNRRVQVTEAPVRRRPLGPPELLERPRPLPPLPPTAAYPPRPPRAPGARPGKPPASIPPAGGFEPGSQPESPRRTSPRAGGDPDRVPPTLRGPREPGGPGPMPHAGPPLGPGSHPAPGPHPGGAPPAAPPISSAEPRGPLPGPRYPTVERPRRPGLDGAEPPAGPGGKPGGLHERPGGKPGGLRDRPGSPPAGGEPGGLRDRPAPWGPGSQPGRGHPPALDGAEPGSLPPRPGLDPNHGERKPPFRPDGRPGRPGWRTGNGGAPERERPGAEPGFRNTGRLPISGGAGARPSARSPGQPIRSGGGHRR